MIQDRLANNGKISEKYRLEFMKDKKKKLMDNTLTIFNDLPYSM